MPKKDVEMFVLEKRKNEALRKEWQETAKKGDNLKENEQESFFNKELSPIAKKYGFNFSYNDFYKYKKHNPTSNNDEELSDDELFNVAGGQAIGCSMGPVACPQYVRSGDNKKKCNVLQNSHW